MTYKSAAAGLDCGGGKTVIMEMDGMDRTLALKTLGDILTSAGEKVYGQRSGCFTEDIDLMRTETRWVADETPAGVEIYQKPRLMGFTKDKSLFGRSYGTILERSTHLRSGCGRSGYWVVKYAIENGAKVTISDIHQGD